MGKFNFDFEDDLDSDVIVEDEEDVELDKPKMYRILLHNDDYTTMEFVVFILESVFHKSEVESNKIMLEVHKKGVGIVGIYPYEQATTSVYLVEKLAEKQGYPLKCSMEEVDI